MSINNILLNYITGSLNFKQQNLDNTSDLVSFYTKDQENWNGIKLSEVLKYDLDTLEYCHNYIQWLFPTKTESLYSYSPILSDENIILLKENEQFHKYYKQAFIKMCDFYGFVWDNELNELVKSGYWEIRKDNWMTKNNHNHLRLTRIIESLNQLGYKNEAFNLYQLLLKINKGYPNIFSQITLDFWKEKMEN